MYIFVPDFGDSFVRSCLTLSQFADLDCFDGEIFDVSDPEDPKRFNGGEFESMDIDDYEE